MVLTHDSQSFSNSSHLIKPTNQTQASLHQAGSSSLLKLYENGKIWKMNSKDDDEEEEFSATGNCHKSLLWRRMRKNREAFLSVEEEERSFE